MDKPNLIDPVGFGYIKKQAPCSNPHHLPK